MERDDAPQCVLFCGTTGAGKSRAARAFSKDDYWCSPIGPGGWCDGYMGQPTALFDDFGGKFEGWRLSDVLRITDRYVGRVPIKGGFTMWRPERILITTNFHPREWYDYEKRGEQYLALKRRFTAVYYYPRSGEHAYFVAGTDNWERFWSWCEGGYVVDLEDGPEHILGCGPLNIVLK